MTIVLETSTSEADLQTDIRVPRVAVLIPCLNEELTIGSVVDDFHRVWPTADIYVFDNNSSDRSAHIARSRGARVILVKRRGKGNVVRSMLSRVDADVYVMVDGDGTYAADSLPALIGPILAGEADMVVGARLKTFQKEAFRPAHHWGNQLFCRLTSTVFGTNLKDILSGYRAFNRRTAKHLPIVSSGFEVEVEITIQCLYYDFNIEERDVAYLPRRDGSISKLNTYRDGLAILMKIFHLLRAYKPLTFFGMLGLISLLGGVVLGTAASVLPASYQNGPISIWSLLQDACVLFGGVFIATGIILHTFNYRVKELHSVLQKSSPDLQFNWSESMSGQVLAAD